MGDRSQRGAYPRLTGQKSFNVEISRTRDRADLVPNDAAELRAQLQAVTGERIAALEGIGEAARGAEDQRDRSVGPDIGKGRHGPASSSMDREMHAPGRCTGRGLGL